MNTFICSSYLRAVTISANSRSLWCLFEGGYYSKCGVYLGKYGISFSTFYHHRMLVDTVGYESNVIAVSLL